MEVSPIAALSYQPTQKKIRGGELDKNAFLKILVAQLRYQDPMQPQDNASFINQMAQFTILEQLQNLNCFQQFIQGVALIGRKVEIREGSGQVVSGLVEKVNRVDDEVKVVVNGTAYDPGQIVLVE